MKRAECKRLGILVIPVREWAEREANECSLNFPQAAIELLEDVPGWIVRLRPGEDTFSAGNGFSIELGPKGGAT